MLVFLGGKAELDSSLKAFILITQSQLQQVLLYHPSFEVHRTILFSGLQAPGSRYTDWLHSLQLGKIVRSFHSGSAE